MYVHFLHLQCVYIASRTKRVNRKVFRCGSSMLVGCSICKRLSKQNRIDRTFKMTIDSEL